MDFDPTFTGTSSSYDPSLMTQRGLEWYNRPRFEIVK
jgi:hypothetical protein